MEVRAPRSTTTRLGVCVLLAVLVAPWAPLAAQDVDPESVARAETDAEGGEPTTPETTSSTESPPPPGGVDPGLHGDDDGEEEIVPAPPTPISREEAEEEEERRFAEAEDALPPPPDPEWRLRLGAGVGLPLNGASSPYLRLYQEIEWQPTIVAPLIFGLGGAEYLVGGLLGSAGARVGLATYFCADAIVRCQAAINVVLGAFFGQGVLAFDFGGEGDVRFLFGALELTVRLGFGGGGGINMLHGGAGVGAAF